MLTAAETAALRNLAEKRTGSLTAFVNVADARRLTELGLAQRSQQGWDITPTGSAHLASLDTGAKPSELHLIPPDRTLHAAPARDDEAGESSDQDGLSEDKTP